MDKTAIEAWIDKWGTNLDWEAKAKLREAVQEMLSTEPSQQTIKLSIDASEALETLAKVKAELEQVIALQEKVGTDNK